jgi:homocysteine S-methyltransferase
MKKALSQALRDEVLIFDGAMGTEIYKRHVFVNVCFDNLCLSNPDLVSEIYESYYNAGADVITTNSFGANREKLREFGIADDMEKINQAAASLARKIADQNEDRQVFVAGSIGIVPWNHNSDAQLITELSDQAKALVKGGADFIIFESMSSRRDLQLAVAAMENLPETEFVLSFSLEPSQLSPNGEDIDTMMASFDSPAEARLAAWGLNCAVGPESMLNSLGSVVKKTDLPVVVQPNAGVPRKVSGRRMNMSSPEYLATYSMRYVNLGARAVGGCCGTTPQHIKELVGTVKPFHKKHFVVEEKVAEEVELKEPTPLEERSLLGRKLANNEWITSIEITPPRGYDLSGIIEKAKVCKEAGVDLINIPDGPRASSRMSALVTAIMIKEQAGIDPFLHVCCRDRNLIGLQSDLLGCAAAGINDVLFITGDPPKLGKYPFASAVFDADAIGITQIQSRLNRGVDLGGEELPVPTKCVIGVGADPNAIDLEKEISRFHQKVEAGAEVVITQPVFDPDALLSFMDKIDPDYRIPVIAGIWPLASYRNAVFMQNEVPGVHVPDWIMEEMGKYESREDQRKAGIEIARQSLEKIRSRVQGVQVSAPFGNVNTALAVLK